MSLKSFFTPLLAQKEKTWLGCLFNNYFAKLASAWVQWVSHSATSKPNQNRFAQVD
jgi:hypothetical protein